MWHYLHSTFSATIKGFMRFPRLSTALTILAAALLPIAASAQGNPCPGPILPCVTGGTTGIQAYVATVVFPGLRLLFIGIAILFFFVYAVRLMLESSEESVITDTKSAYAQAITGAAIVGLATLIV